MRGWIVVAVFALALTGCGATADETRDETGGGGEASMSAGAAVERCSERLLSNAELEELTAEEREAARRYAESTYCARFAERGWVYDDGTLSIDAYRWLAEAGEDVCAEAEAAQEGEPAGPVRTVPCDEVDAGEDPGIIDCAGLQYFERARFANTWMGSSVATAASNARTARLSPTSERNSHLPSSALGAARLVGKPVSGGRGRSERYLT